MSIYQMLELQFKIQLPMIRNYILPTIIGIHFIKTWSVHNKTADKSTLLIYIILLFTIYFQPLLIKYFESDRIDHKLKDLFSAYNDDDNHNDRVPNNIILELEQQINKYWQQLIHSAHVKFIKQTNIYNKRDRLEKHLFRLIDGKSYNNMVIQFNGTCIINDYDLLYNAELYWNQLYKASEERLFWSHESWSQ